MFSGEVAEIWHDKFRVLPFIKNLSKIHKVTMNCYFLTGTFAFSVADSMDPGKRCCTVIGKRAFHCSEAVMQVLAAIDRQSDIGEITAAVNRARSGPALTEDTIRQLIVDAPDSGRPRPYVPARSGSPKEIRRLFVRQPDNTRPLGR